MELCCFSVVVNLGKAGVGVADGDVEAQPWISEGTASHLTPSSLTELQLTPQLYSEAWEEVKQEASTHGEPSWPPGLGTSLPGLLCADTDRRLPVVG